MGFQDVIAQAEVDLQAQTLAAKQYVLNVIDLASQEATIIAPLAEADVLNLINNAIPATNSAAKNFLNEIVSGVEKPASEFINKEVTTGFLLAKNYLNSLISVNAAPANTVTETSVTATSTTVQTSGTDPAEQVPPQTM